MCREYREATGEDLHSFRGDTGSATEQGAMPKAVATPCRESEMPVVVRKRLKAQRARSEGALVGVRFWWEAQAGHECQRG